MNFGEKSLKDLKGQCDMGEECRDEDDECGFIDGWEFKELWRAIGFVLSL